MSTSRLRQGMARMNLRGGLGAVLGQALFPLPSEVEQATDPETLRKLRNQAMMQMGLGMMTASGKGASTSAGLGYGISQGEEALTGGLGQILGVRRQKREDQRLDLAEKRQVDYDQRQQDQYKREGEWREQDVQRHGAERAQDVASRAADDARMLESANLQKKLAHDAQERQYWTERLSGNLASLRATGAGDDDPLVIKLLTHLKGLGVNQYMPTNAGYGLGLGNGLQLPDLSSFSD